MAELKKSLGFWMIVAVSFLNLVNTGMFFGLQIGARQAGIDVLIALGILAIVSIYIAMCFAELTSMFPVAGGVYEFGKQAYGRFASFLIGWTVWVAGNIATALFTVAAVDALPSSVFPTNGFFIGSIFISALVAKIALSILLVLLLNYIAYRGIDASAKLMVLLMIFMVGLIAVIIISGAPAVNPANLSGFTWRWSVTMLAIFFLSETFFGWEAASYMSEETEDAANTIPKALVTTTTLVALFIVAIAIIIIGVLGIGSVTNAAQEPILLMLESVHVIPAVLTVVSVGIVIALLGNASGNVISLPRLLLAMSRDKLFIEQFSDIHPVRQTPHKAILFQTIVSITIIVVALTIPAAKGLSMYEMLLSLLVPISLVLYASIIILVPYFRWRRPQHPRPFRAPLGGILPVFVSLFFVALLVVWVMQEPNAIVQLRLLFSFVFFSIPIYMLLTYFYDPDSLVSTLSFFSRINLWLERMIVPKRVRQDIIDMFHQSEGKHILEFGSGVGTITVHLAEQVGKEGKVYAVGLSEADTNILKKRMNKLGHGHVEVIHDPHFINRIHPSVRYVDMIVSINHLGYIQDVKKVLKEMNAIMPRRGHIYFVEYIDFFYFLPNPAWLSDPETVKKVFADAGFNVTVRVKRGLLWKYLYIYGIKETHDVPYI